MKIVVKSKQKFKNRRKPSSKNYKQISISRHYYECIKLEEKMIKVSESKSESSIINHFYRSIYPTHRRLSTSVSLIHKIPEYELPFLNISDEYDIQQMLAEGYFAKIFLTYHRPTKSTVVLKACHIELSSKKDFLKEFHYNYQLSHVQQILSCYQVKFQTKDYFIYAMEYAPFGDLASHVGSSGIPESCCKKISDQLSSALGFMHSKGLVHRDLKLENILVFNLDFSKIKLCDFGSTQRQGVLVGKNTHIWSSFIPPEVLEIVRNEKYCVRPSSDVWQFGIILFLCLTGSSPWLKADWVKDPKYCAFMKYQKKETTKIPDNFRKFTPRLLRAFRRIFDHKETERAKVTDITKYIEDKWLNTKVSQSRSVSNLGNNSFRVSNAPSDHDSTKYINHKDSRTPVDERSRMKRLMSSFGIHDNRNLRLDPSYVEHRVNQWLIANESNFKNFDHLEEDLNLEYWQSEEIIDGKKNLLTTKT